MQRRILKTWTWLISGVVLLSLTGCVVATRDTLLVPPIRSLFEGTYKVDPYMEQHRPVTIAVLPFLDNSRKKEGAAEVRKGFYNHFSSLPFKDMELRRVDNLLKKADLEETEALYRTSPQELGKILNVDAVVFGEISNFDKLFAVVYSQVAVGAEIKMYDTRTGKFLWSGMHTVRIHEGGISTNPVGIIATVIATSMNVRDIQLLRACDDLFREMVKTIPTPALAEALRPPLISLLTQDTRNLPKKAGEEIKIVIRGAPKMQAYFDIGDFKRHIEMEELETGGYLGTYKVLPGDNVTQALITGYLADDSGNTAQWVDALGSVTIDTTPPEKARELQTQGGDKAVSLKWGKSPAPDLAGYRIYRSQTPLSGFQEVGTSEFTEWRDERAVNGQKYFYQLTAYDRAGNESEKSDAVLGLPIAPGPTPVSGVIAAETTWYAGASPYVLEQTVTVKGKGQLTIEPGTEILIKNGGLVVEGQLKAQGTKERLISFTAAVGTREWEGISFRNVKENENYLQYLRITKAKTALTCEAASPQIADSELTDNGQALKISGAFSRPALHRNMIHHNREEGVVISAGAQPVLTENSINDNGKAGVYSEAASPVLNDNLILRNQGCGIIVQKSTARLGGNKLRDNKPLDMQADMTGEPVQALDNWWGTVNGGDILSRIRGKINIATILDKEEGGKSIKLPILESMLGGTIAKDAFLILSHSPYQVASDVLITGGATLTIEPGVAILYEQKRTITVEDGGVIAKGSKELPILFSAAGAAPMPGFYGSAIRFTKPTKINSIFSYCIFKYAETAFDIHYGAPEISYCHITKNSQNGIFCRNDAAPKISFNFFDHNFGEGAIRSVGMSKPVLNYNNFLNNTFAIQAFSSIYLDARHNWWGKTPPAEQDIFKHSEESINITPWLERPEERAFREK